MNPILQPISLTEFEYNLPDERIAKFPLSERDESKLLFYQRGAITHHTFSTLPFLLPSSSSLLFNKSRVVPARIEFFKETGTRIEVFLLEPYEMEYSTAFAGKGIVRFRALIGNKKRWKDEQTLHIGMNQFDLYAEWVNREDNIVSLRWTSDVTFSELLETIGKLPLPPYLHRDAETSDYQTYQTVFAEEEGAVAAPTAGLHFTDKILKSLAVNGVITHKMTLHVSAGTFLPVTVSNVLEHPMHNEVFYFDKEDVQYLFGAECLIPVGTTSLRMVESLYWMGVALLKDGIDTFSLDKFYPYQFFDKNIHSRDVKAALLSYIEKHPHQRIRASTRLMIVPGYKPQLCKGLITNFHQPSSTLIMLVASLIGKDWKKVYTEAMSNQYRFLSYGDSSLLIW